MGQLQSSLQKDGWLWNWLGQGGQLQNPLVNTKVVVHVELVYLFTAPENGCVDSNVILACFKTGQRMCQSFKQLATLFTKDAALLYVLYDRICSNNSTHKQKAKTCEQLSCIKFHIIYLSYTMSRQLRSWLDSFEAGQLVSKLSRGLELGLNIKIIYTCTCTQWVQLACTCACMYAKACTVTG